MMKRLLACVLVVVLVGCATASGVSGSVPVGNTLRVDNGAGMTIASAAVVSVSETCDIVALTARHVSTSGDISIRGAPVAARNHATADLAMLTFSLPACGDLRTVTVAPGRKGAEIYATGYTLNGMASVQRGLFYATPVVGHVGEVALPVAAYYGMSGGGVYLDTGELVGLVVGGWPEFVAMSRVVLLTPEVLRGVGL